MGDITEIIRILKRRKKAELEGEKGDHKRTLGTTAELKNEGLSCITANRKEPGTDILIPGWPNEAAIRLIARIPRSHHCEISCVSRSWRNLLQRREFSNLRQELSIAEEWLYLWTRVGNVFRCFDADSKIWFKLPPVPDDDERIGGHSGFGSFDGKLFVVGGIRMRVVYAVQLYKIYIPCATVSYFDVRRNCWTTAANLHIPRAKCTVETIDNRLYVFGGLVEGRLIDGTGTSTRTAEVYDPMTDTWTLVENMGASISLTVDDSVVMDGRAYVVGPPLGNSNRMGAVYDARTNTWEDMTNGLKSGWKYKAAVLNDKLYTIADQQAAGTQESEWSDCDYEIERLIYVYNPTKDVWERVKGIGDKGKPEILALMGHVELVSFGGKLCIVSTGKGDFGTDYDHSMINVRILKVQGSIEDMSCAETFRDEFEILFENELEEPEILEPESDDEARVARVPRTVKRCHVIAL